VVREQSRLWRETAPSPSLSPPQDSRGTPLRPATSSWDSRRQRKGREGWRSDISKLLVNASVGRGVGSCATRRPSISSERGCGYSARLSVDEGERRAEEAMWWEEQTRPKGDAEREMVGGGVRLGMGEPEPASTWIEVRFSKGLAYDSGCNSKPPAANHRGGSRQAERRRYWNCLHPPHPWSLGARVSATCASSPGIAPPDA